MGTRRGARWLAATTLAGCVALLAAQHADLPLPRGLGVRARAQALLVPTAAAQAATPAAAVTVDVATDQPLRPISPLIYGAAEADAATLAAEGLRLNRWGGNPSSRYNWELGNAWNAASDWQFRNGNYGHTAATDRRPSGAADQFVATNRAAGAHSFITIPALGWVAANDDNATRSVGAPSEGGPPVAPGADAVAGYDPAANQAATSVRSLARKGAPFSDPPDLTDNRVYQDEWVHHLVDQFGAAGSGGVAFYAVDNEPDLWSSTQADVHPVQPGYDDVRDTFLTYAEAIKDVDPAAQVVGPSVSGWTGYFYSARDRGQDNFRSHADRAAHGDQPFLPWWLDQVRQHDESAGRRTLDYLDVHYYPQAKGVYSGKTDAATDALRLRSTRSLWDPSYVDESWIREPVRLIPRLREWIDQAYPGTKLAIGEWSWGADKDVNGALAIDDVLGIFGREGVDLAAYWTHPAVGSPGALAFALYTNYDGHGAHFGDLALPATSDAPDAVSVYASRDSASGDLVLVAINKQPDSPVSTSLHLDGFVATAAQAHLYQYGAADPSAIHDLGTLAVDGSSQIAATLPASSVTVIRVTQ